MNENNQYPYNDFPPPPQIPTKICPKCKAQIGKSLQVCPYCGKKQGIKIGCLGAIGIFFLICLFLASMSSCMSALSKRNRSADVETTSPAVTETIAQPAETTQAAENRSQKNGFSDASNSTVQVGQYAFSVPSYWGADITEPDNYRAYAEKGGKVAMLTITANTDENDVVSYDALVVDDENMKETIAGWFDSCQDVTSEPLEVGDVRGYRYSANCVMNGYDGYCECFIFPSENDNKWVLVQMLQTNNTKYQYTEDFRKILNSISHSEITEATAESTSVPEPETTQAVTIDPREAVNNGDYSLVTPEFKSLMDSYEAFYDEYIAFMNKYTSGENDMMSMLNDYTTMMNRMEEWSDKIDAIDESTLTPADDAYYLLVTLRIEQKLLGTAYGMGQ